MKIDNELFQTALKSVSVINTKKLGPEESVKLMKVEATKGLFRMSVSEGGQYAFTEIECDGELKPICIPAHSLATIAPLFDKNVSMDVKATKLEIRSKGSFSVPTMPVEQFTAIPVEKLTKIGVNCGDVAECVDRVRFAARKSDDRPTLHGVNVKLLNKKIIAEAATGHVVAVMEKPGITAEAEFLIPFPFVPHVVNALKADGAVLSVHPSRVMVQYNGGCYSCVLQEGKFPAITQGMNGKKVKLGDIKGVDWLPVFRTVVAMAGDSISPRVTVKEGRITFEEGPQTLDRAIDKLAKVLRLNAATFIPCLEAFGDAEIKMHVYDGDGSVRMDHGDLTVLSVQLR